MIDKATALYYNPESIGSDDGARCGICRFYQDHTCKIVEGSINPDTGICGLYVKEPISKKEAGYAENGPTHCFSCEYMIVKKLFGESRCGKVEGMIEGRGCCNLWEKS
jgi:hypothetical protein